MAAHDPPEYNPEAEWETTALAGALRAFQSELPEVKKSATGQYGKYADLAPVTREIIPRLAKHGLAWLCKPMLVDGQFVLRYKLTHVPSGEAEEGDYPLRTVNAQQQGSEITYARRYCLLAMTGVAPEGDDDDGKAATKPRAQRTAAKKPGPDHDQLREGAAQGRVNGVQRGPVPPEEDHWDGQPAGQIPRGNGTVGLIQQHFKRLKVEDRSMRLAYTASLAHRATVASTNDLTEDEASDVLRQLTRLKDKDHLDRLVRSGERS